MVNLEPSTTDRTTVLLLIPQIQHHRPSLFSPSKLADINTGNGQTLNCNPSLQGPGTTKGSWLLTRGSGRWKTGGVFSFGTRRCTRQTLTTAKAFPVKINTERDSLMKLGGSHPALFPAPPAPSWHPVTETLGFMKPCLPTQDCLPYDKRSPRKKLGCEGKCEERGT